jgi:hypothetical protein
LPPMSPAWVKLAVKKAKLNGQNVREEDMGMEQPAAPEGGAPQGEVLTETSPLNAYSLKHPPKL